MVRALLVVLLLLTACGPPSAPPGHTLTGSVTLYGESRTPTCEGTSGYDDIKAEAPVTVKDEAGVIVGSGRLGASTSQADTRYPCVFPINVGGIGSAKFYSIQVGHRGALTYSAAEMDKMGWKVELEIGK